FIATIALREEQSFLQTGRSIEQNVVEDRVFVEQTTTRADYGLPCMERIPSNSNLGCEVPVWLVHSITKSRNVAKVIQQISSTRWCWAEIRLINGRARNWPQIAIRAAGVS